MIEIEEHIGFKGAVNFAGYDFIDFIVFNNNLSLEEQKIQKMCGYFTTWKIAWWCTYGIYGAKAAKMPLDKLIWPPY